MRARLVFRSLFKAQIAFLSVTITVSRLTVHF